MVQHVGLCRCKDKDRIKNGECMRTSPTGFQRDVLNIRIWQYFDLQNGVAVAPEVERVIH